MLRVIDAPETAIEMKLLTVYFHTRGKLLHVNSCVATVLEKSMKALSSMKKSQEGIYLIYRGPEYFFSCKQ